MKNKCKGCGAFLQTTDLKQIGYAKDLNHDYCLECFNLVNYGKSELNINPNTYLEIKPNSLVLVVASIMQLDLLFSLPIEKIQNNAKYIYVINKVDLLPSDTNLDHLIKEIVKRAYLNKIGYEDVILMSALNPLDIKNLSAHLKQFSNENIYLFGYQNSGKSTLFKALTNNTKVLNLNKAGLTKEIITDKLESKTISDMPGDYIKGTLADIFSYNEYKKLLPLKKIKPKMYFLKNNQKLIINDFVEITVLTNDLAHLVIYLSEFNKLDKYNINNPNNYLNSKYNYQNKSFKLDGKNKHTITISDLLFINTNAKATINIKLPKELRITNMESLLK